MRWYRSDLALKKKNYISLIKVLLGSALLLTNYQRLTLPIGLCIYSLIFCFYFICG